MGIWQPIESAPKDGTLIRARGRDWGDRQEPFHYVRTRYVAGKGFVGVKRKADTTYPYLTDWQPLPAPPESEA